MFKIMRAALAFLSGLCVGSFLNVVAIRFTRGETIVRGRSYCPYCKKELLWFDMIPVASFFLLRGRCRFCKSQISFQYVTVELLCGILFFLVALKFGYNVFSFLFFLFFAALFLLISVVDIRSHLIPSPLLLIGLGGGIAYVVIPPVIQSLAGLSVQRMPLSVPHLFSFLSILQPPSFLQNPLGEQFFAAFLTGGFILFLVLVTRERGMGMGDAPIGFLQGLLLGYPAGLLALFLSFIIGAILGVGLMLRHKAGMKTALPFAPFLVTGLFLILFLG